MASLRTKLTLSHLFVTLLIAFTIGTSVYFLLKHFLHDKYQDLQLQQATHLTVDITHYLENKEQLLQKIASDTSVQSFPETFRVIPLAKHFLDFTKDFPTLRYINEKGIEELSVTNGNIREERVDFTNALFFQEAIQRSPATVTLAVPGIEGVSKPAFLMASGMRHYFEDRFIGMIVGISPIPDMPFFSSVTFSPNSHSFLIDSKLNILSSSKKYNQQDFESIAANKEVNLLISSNKLSINHFEVYGMHSLVTHAPFSVAGIDLHVLNVWPMDDMLKTARMLRNTIFTIGIVSCLLIGSLAYFLVKNMVLPLRLLKEATQKSSTKDLKAVDIKYKNDEIGELVTAFNHMALHLEESTVSRNYFNSIIQGMQNSLIVVLPDNTIQSVNAATCDLLEIKSEEMLGRNASDFITESHEEHDSFDHLIKNTTERIYRSSKGTEIPVLFSSTPLKDDQGNIEGTIYIAQDISDRIKLEGQLYQSQKMEAIGTLAGGIAHDFNNILTAIIGYSEFIKKAVPADSPIGKDVDNVLVAGRRAAELVKQILTFSRKTDSAKQDVYPHLLVNEALAMLKATLPTSITIEVDIDPNCGMILASPTNIHQIIVNLCTNASHAMTDKKGVLSVSLQSKKCSVAEIIGKTALPAGDFVVLTVTQHCPDWILHVK